MNFEANEFAAFRAQRCLRGRCESMDCDKGQTAWWIASAVVGLLFLSAVWWAL